MSDELHKYPGNLKHHKVEPLLSDDDIMQSDSRSPAYEVRDIYEAYRYKDAELIQALVDEVSKWMGPNIDERFRGPEWYKSKSVLDAAAASGYKPSEQ